MIVSEYPIPYAEFQEFISKYKACFEGEKNRILKVKNLDTHFESVYALSNPELVLANDDLIPTINAKRISESHFYLNRNSFDNENFLFYMKVSFYEIDNIEGSGQKLGFHVINKIASVIELKKRLSKRLHKKIIQSKKYKTMGEFNIAGLKLDHRLVETIDNGKMYSINYFSDIDWSIRDGFWYGPHFPLNLVNLYIPFIDPETTQYEAPGIIFTRDYLQQYKLSPLLEKVINNFNPKMDLNYPLMWYDRELALISQFEMPTLLKYLNHQEIPLWLSILFEAKNRPINEYEIEYLNKTIPIILEICSENLNALNLEVLDLVRMLIFIGINMGVLTQCQYCNRIIRFRKYKKFCSMTTEGRNCRKSDQNKRYYNKYQDRIRDRSKMEMRLTRQLERKHKK